MFLIKCYVLLNVQCVLITCSMFVWLDDKCVDEMLDVFVEKMLTVCLIKWWVFSDKLLNGCLINCSMVVN